MADLQKHLMPEEVHGGPSVPEAAPPPYPPGLIHMQPDPPYQPPPYPQNPAVYPYYPPIEAACNTGPIPSQAYPAYAPVCGGCVAGDLPPEECKGIENAGTGLNTQLGLVYWTIY